MKFIKAIAFSLVLAGLSLGPSAFPARAEDWSETSKMTVQLSIEEQCFKQMVLAFEYADRNHDGELTAVEAGRIGLDRKEFYHFDKDFDEQISLLELAKSEKIREEVFRLRLIESLAQKANDLDGDQKLSLKEYMATKLDFHRFATAASPKANNAFKKEAFLKTVGSENKLSKESWERLFCFALEQGYYIDYRE